MRAHLPSDESWADCKCPEPGAWGLFIWRGDREWWSCMACDGRVRPLTAGEKRDRASGNPGGDDVE